MRCGLFAINRTNLFLAALAVVNTTLLFRSFHLAAEALPPLLPLWTGTWTCRDDPAAPCFQLDAHGTGRFLLADPAGGHARAALPARLVGMAEDRLVFFVDRDEDTPPGQKQRTTSESYLLLRRSDGGATLARIIVRPPDFEVVYAPVAELAVLRARTAGAAACCRSAGSGSAASYESEITASPCSSGRRAARAR